MMNAVLFSVVICTYNRAAILHRSVESVLAQTWEDFELVIVDDGSVDETPSVVASYDDRRIRAIRRANGGLSVARNTGIDAAQGDFVVFLDDDDRADPDWLASLASEISDDVGIVSCGARRIRVDGGEVSLDMPRRMPKPFGHVTARFLAGTFATRRSLYLDVGGYAEEMLISHQTELSLRLLPRCAELGLRVRAIDRPLVDIEVREVADRPLSQPDAVLAGTTYLIEHHRDQLAIEPPRIARYYAMGGVAAAQCGDLHTARAMLREAVRYHPRRFQHWQRLVVSYVPPLAHRLWGRHWR
jgi:Glycosyl transferase family 2